MKIARERYENMVCCIIRSSSCIYKPRKWSYFKKCFRARKPSQTPSCFFQCDVKLFSVFHVYYLKILPYADKICEYLGHITENRIQTRSRYTIHRSLFKETHFWVDTSWSHFLLSLLFSCSFNYYSLLQNGSKFLKARLLLLFRWWLMFDLIQAKLMMVRSGCSIKCTLVFVVLTSAKIH